MISAKRVALCLAFLLKLIITEHSFAERVAAQVILDDTRLAADKRQSRQEGERLPCSEWPTGCCLHPEST